MTGQTRVDSSSTKVALDGLSESLLSRRSCPGVVDVAHLRSLSTRRLCTVLDSALLRRLLSRRGLNDALVARGTLVLAAPRAAAAMADTVDNASLEIARGVLPAALEAAPGVDLHSAVTTVVAAGRSPASTLLAGSAEADGARKAVAASHPASAVADLADVGKILVQARAVAEDMALPIAAGSVSRSQATEDMIPLCAAFGLPSRPAASTGADLPERGATLRRGKAIEPGETAVATPGSADRRVVGVPVHEPFAVGSPEVPLSFEALPPPLPEALAGPRPRELPGPAIGADLLLPPNPLPTDPRRAAAIRRREQVRVEVDGAPVDREGLILAQPTLPNARVTTTEPMSAASRESSTVPVHDVAARSQRNASAAVPVAPTAEIPATLTAAVAADTAALLGRGVESRHLADSVSREFVRSMRRARERKGIPSWKS